MFCYLKHIQTYFCEMFCLQSAILIKRKDNQTFICAQIFFWWSRGEERLQISVTDPRRTEWKGSVWFHLHMVPTWLTVWGFGTTVIIAHGKGCMRRIYSAAKQTQTHTHPSTPIKLTIKCHYIKLLLGKCLWKKL